MSAPHRPSSESEPTTPMWLPAVGAVLFSFVGVYWATRPSVPPITADTQDAGAAAANSAGAPSAAAPPSAATAAARPSPGSVRAPAPRPNPSGGPHDAEIRRLMNNLPKK